MTRKARTDTAEVTLRFRVPRGVTGADAKKLIWNHLTGTSVIYPDGYEEDLFGSATIKPVAVAGKVIRAKAKR